MMQYKTYLEDNYTKATVDTYFKDITIFNNFLKDREINRSIIYEFKIYLI
jgi:site-specific recombinase XerD